MIRQFQYMSDLHTEFDNRVDKNPEFDDSFMPEKVSDYLILAGDIVAKHSEHWLEKVANNWEYVFYVFGNHEFYGTRFFKRKLELKELCHSLGIIVLDDDFYMLGDVPIIGSTMWTDLSDPRDEYFAKSMMNDYSKITWDKDGYHKLSPKNTTKLWIEAKNFLDKTLEMFKNRKTVVITHTAPSITSINNYYRYSAHHSILNKAFYVDMEDLILKHSPNVWVHGHVHTSVENKIGDTKVLCNPRGYFGYEENPEFDSTKTFSL